jgi:hypothetical protein
MVYDGSITQSIEDFYALYQVDNVHRYTEDEAAGEIARTWPPPMAFEGV